MLFPLLQKKTLTTKKLGIKVGLTLRRVSLEVLRSP